MQKWSRIIENSWNNKKSYAVDHISLQKYDQQHNYKFFTSSFLT